MATPHDGEAATAPLPETTAWSVDGWEFTCRGPLHRGLRLGSYLEVEDAAGGARVGGIRALRLHEDASGRQLEVRGRLLDGGDDPAPFDDARVRVASTEALHRLTDDPKAGLVVGSLRTDPQVPARLRAGGLNRHTFLCGQSGSGKTYSLGVLLEQILLGTRLPVLVIDPNGDHVHLGQTREETDADLARRYLDASRGTRVLAAQPGEDFTPLRVRFSEAGLDGIAALLGLDPIADREEYNALVHFFRQAPAEGLDSIDAASDLMATSSEQLIEALHMRIENLGIDAMTVWSYRTTPTALDHWERPETRAVVADTSGFETRRERLLLTVAVLQGLWQRRLQRRPLLLVVDEAHDVCPAEPGDPLERLATDLFTRIAGEGRKYGIHLLLATQRPDKLPENVLSQCDNLLLMRVNSAGDRHALAERFGFAPPALVDLAGSFGLGEALLVGQIAPVPMLVRMGGRISPEGGADLGNTWALPPEH